jgi:hypothetical protein
MQLVLSGIGILFILFAWNFAFLPALRGRCLDRLEDLRGENFSKGKSERRGLSARMHRDLDKFIVSHIEDIDRISIVGFLIFARWHRRNEVAASMIERDIQKRFDAQDAELNNFSDYIRREVAFIFTMYLGRKYFILWIAAIGVTPLLVMHKGYRACWAAADAVARKTVAVTGASFEPQAVRSVLDDAFFMTSR